MDAANSDGGEIMSQELVDETPECKREWVGLTDEEFEEILRDFSHDPRLLAVEIEVRLTERNI